MPVLTGIRRRLPIIQRQIMTAAEASGVTHEVAAMHLGCSSSRVDWWTSSKPREMTLGDYLGLVEVSGDPVGIMEPIARATGHVVVPVHETDDHEVGALEMQALTAGGLVGRLQAEVCEAKRDGRLDDDERARIRAAAVELIGELQALVGGLDASGPRAVAR